MSIKRALCLSGGGARGSYQVGAIKALTESGRQWHSVHGISAGSLNAAWISMFSPDQQKTNIDGLVDVWQSIKSSDDIYKKWSKIKPINYLYSMWKGSLHSGAPLRKLLGEFFKKENIAIPLTVGCVNLHTSEYHSISNQDENISEYILASCHLPLVFEPIVINGQKWVDGGIRHQIPILDALKTRPDEIDIILASPISIRDRLTEEYDLRSAPKIALRASEIMSDQIYLQDCYTALRAIKTAPDIKINLFVPSVLLIQDSLNFIPEQISKNIELGYNETKKKLIDISDILREE
jgi:NTE family protein